MHNFMNSILANSKSVLLQLNKLEDVNEKKLSLIYNGIDINLLKSKKYLKNKSFYKIKNNQIIITITANLIKYKGHQDLLKACAKLTCKKWTLILIGEDRNNLKKKLINFAEKNNIKDNIKILGLRDDVFDILSITDIGVLTSRRVFKCYT